MSQLPTRWTASDGLRPKGRLGPRADTGIQTGRRRPRGAILAACYSLSPACTRDGHSWGGTNRGTSIVPHARSTNGFTPMRTGVIGSVLLKVSLIEHRRGNSTKPIVKTLLFMAPLVPKRSLSIMALVGSSGTT